MRRILLALTISVASHLGVLVVAVDDLDGYPAFLPGGGQAGLTYTFTRHLSSELGYNFDWYTTPAPGQDYTRNRVYLGVTATY